MVSHCEAQRMVSVLVSASTPAPADDCSAAAMSLRRTRAAHPTITSTGERALAFLSFSTRRADKRKVSGPRLR